MIDPEISRLIAEIRTDTSHGASQLARRAAEVLGQAANTSRGTSAHAILNDLLEVAQQLETVRPAMAPLYNIVAGIRGVLEEKLPGKFPEEARRLAEGLAEGAVQQSVLAVARVADYAAGLIPDGATVLTHSYSSTVVAALRRAAQDKTLSALVTRSGAGRSGGTLAAELAANSLKVALIDDAAVGIYATRAEIVCIGADRITRDAVLVNGVGTLNVALAARNAGVPCYSLCESLKFDPRINAAAVDLEDRDAAEIDAGEASAEMPRQNPHFDLTPLDLLSGVVTEGGVMTLDEVRASCQLTADAGPGLGQLRYRLIIRDLGGVDPAQLAVFPVQPDGVP